MPRSTVEPIFVAAESSALDAEAIHDAVLAVSGQLDLAMGGPSVRQFFFKDDHSPIYDYARFDVDDPGALGRRSVYRFIVRQRAGSADGMPGLCRSVLADTAPQYHAHGATVLGAAE